MISLMKATFTELPPFERHRQSYLNDESFRKFQKMLMKNPEAGDVIEGTMDDLTAAQRKILKELLKQELDARRIK